MAGEISIGSATSAIITGSTTPAQFIADVQSGKWAKQVAAVRAATGDERDRLKKLLPAILWAGKFTARKNDGIESFSGLICADVDKIAGRVGELHDIARKDSHAAAAFVSPSGMGIKIVFCVPIAVDAKGHLLNFTAVRAHVASHYNAQVDEAAKDVARLCFVSHDTAAFYKTDAVPLKSVPIEAKQSATSLSIAPSMRTQIAEKLLGAIQWGDGGGFCQCPGEHLHTSANGKKDCKVMLDSVPTIKCFHNSCAGIVDGVNHELRSQISKTERPAALSSIRAAITAEYLGEKSESQIDISARLALVRFNIHEPPPLETVVFKLSTGATTHTRGNISVITAQAKAGKSALNAALIASSISTQPDDCDTLGFRAVNPDKLPDLLLDTEHSKEHNWKLGERILRRAKLAESDQLHIYRMAGFTVKELNAALEHLLTERKWHAVFLDGTGDFVSDVNDPEECNAFVARLHGLAIEHDTHILNVLHLNPSSETKSRGHLGSQLERKAETNLRIEKKDAISIIYSDRNRGAEIPKDTAPRFIWSLEHQMHVSVETIGNIKASAKMDELREQCQEAFRLAGKSALSWTDLVKSIRKVPGVKSDRTAERIHKDAKVGGIITRNMIGQWEMV